MGCTLATSTASLLLVVAASLAAYWIYWRRRRYTRLIDAIPGPSGWPLIGNAVQLAVDKATFLRVVHVDWVRRHGPIYKGWAANRAMVCIASPQLMEPILNSRNTIDKGIEYSYLSPWLGRCMFLSTGDRWRARRRLLTPAFHFQILQSFFDVFNEQSERLATRLERDADAGGELDVYPLLTRAALDIICETSMGREKRCGVDDDEDDDESDANGAYLSSVNRITQITMERAVRPWLRAAWLFGLSALGRENGRCVDMLHAFTNGVIARRRRQPRRAAPDEKRLAFLDLMIQASEDGTTKLSDDDIREEVDTVMFAGYDTTATAMGWFLHCMATHPEQQQLVFEEIERVFGVSERRCTPEDATEMKYLECCIKETLRLYPSIPGVMRNLTQDVQIGDYTVPAGTSVALLIYGMHHNPDVYEEPDQFRPERFLAENSAGRHPYAFVPFSAGPRNCIGQKYALLELKVVLSTLVRRFAFAAAGSSKTKAVPASEIVLKPVNGIRLHLRRRRRRRRADDDDDDVLRRAELSR